jgi:orotate phosphoribosyltransferase
MNSISQAFIALALRYDVLQFGEFTLKSGRLSPYFFNAGRFHDGAALAALGKLYAQFIIQEKLEFDILFGPAYKGIPLVVSVGIALATEFAVNKPIAFNRKQAKSYGDQGIIVGAPLRGRVLLIDDVITAGTAIRETLPLLPDDATLSAALVAFDRQERGQGSQSSIEELAQKWQINVYSLATLTDVIEYLAQAHSDVPHPETLAIQQYQQRYGAVKVP